MGLSASAFVSRYGALADHAASQTGLSRWTILTQWAVETGWGSSVLCRTYHNLAGVTDGHGSFVHYPDDGAGVAGYIATMYLGYYAAVRATHGQPVTTQLRALAQSPWDAGHYEGGTTTPGRTLYGAWGILAPLAAGSTPPAPVLYRVVVHGPVPLSHTPGGASAGSVSLATYRCRRQLVAGLWWYQITDAGSASRGAWLKPSRYTTVTRA